MDATHLHLALAHFPIIGTLIGAAILAYGLMFKNLALQKGGLITCIIMALITIPVFLTGGEAEETVEDLAGVSEQLIENHEEFAEKAVWLIGIMGALALIAFFMIIKKFSAAKTLTWITLIVSLATFGVFAQLGNLGGQIRHSEIRTSSSYSPENSSQSLTTDDDDDD